MVEMTRIYKIKVKGDDRTQCEQTFDLWESTPDTEFNELKLTITKFKELFMPGCIVEGDKDEGS